MTFAGASVGAIHCVALLWPLRRRRTIQAFGRQHAAQSLRTTSTEE
jgi:hypothetical protein